MSADPERIGAAHLLLDQLGVTLDDLKLAATTPTSSSVPTLADYLPRVIAAAGPGANRTYGNYWRKMLTTWGDRRLDQITASDIEALQHAAAATACSRRNSRHGRHAGEHVIAAARAIYTRAIQAAHTPNRELTNAIRQLREQLARAHGQLRTAGLTSPAAEPARR